jgi:putative tryptophan/tyrosine transport system substrate-binding protein
MARATSACEANQISLGTWWARAARILVRAASTRSSELVAMQPDLILSHTTPTTATLLQQTRSIPIIFAFVTDPLGSGFVASFPRPGGNVTGFVVREEFKSH